MVLIQCIMILWVRTVDFKFGFSYVLEERWTLPGEGRSSSQTRHLLSLPDQPQSPGNPKASDIPTRAPPSLPTCWLHNALRTCFVFMVKWEIRYKIWFDPQIMYALAVQMSIVTIILVKRWLVHRREKVVFGFWRTERALLGGVPMSGPGTMNDNDYKRLPPNPRPSL